MLLSMSLYIKKYYLQISCFSQAHFYGFFKIFNCIKIYQFQNNFIKLFYFQREIQKYSTFTIKLLAFLSHKQIKLFLVIRNMLHDDNNIVPKGNSEHKTRAETSNNKHVHHIILSVIFA
jgi:hypothetical protein